MPTPRLRYASVIAVMSALTTLLGCSQQPAAVPDTAAVTEEPAAVLDLPELSDEAIERFSSFEKDATKATREGEHGEAVRLLTLATSLHAGNAGTWYNLACVTALDGRPEEAMKALESAASLGWTDASWPAKDSDLATLHERDDFKAWLEGLAADDAGWPTIDASRVESDASTIDARLEHQKTALKRIRSVIGARGYRDRLSELEAWRAASWDAIATSRSGDEKIEAQLNALRSVVRDSFPSKLAATEGLRRCELLKASLAGRPELADVLLLEARSRHSLEWRDAEEDGRDAVDERHIQALAAIAESYDDGHAVEEALLGLIENSTSDPETMKRHHARLKTMVAADDLRERMLDSARAAYYLLEGMPEFTAETLAGNKLDRDGLRGKVTLVEFWATWCGPCLEELPNLKEVYEKFHGQGFEIVGISLDEEGDLDRAGFEKWVGEKQVPWTQIYDGLGWKNELAQQFGVDSIPFAILLDRNVNVVAAGEDVRGDALTEQVERLLTPQTAQLR